MAVWYSSEDESITDRWDTAHKRQSCCCCCCSSWTYLHLMVFISNWFHCNQNYIDLSLNKLYSLLLSLSVRGVLWLPRVWHFYDGFLAKRFPMMLWALHPSPPGASAWCLSRLRCPSWACCRWSHAWHPVMPMFFSLADSIQRLLRCFGGVAASFQTGSALSRVLKRRMFRAEKRGTVSVSGMRLLKKSPRGMFWREALSVTAFPLHLFVK